MSLWDRCLKLSLSECVSISTWAQLTEQSAFFGSLYRQSRVSESWMGGGEGAAGGTVGAALVAYRVIKSSPEWNQQEERMGLPWDFKAREVRTQWLWSCERWSRRMWKRRFQSWGQKLLLTVLSPLMSSVLSYFPNFSANASCPLRLHSNACSQPSLSCHLSLLLPHCGMELFSTVAAFLESCTCNTVVRFSLHFLPSFLPFMFYKTNKQTLPKQLLIFLIQSSEKK